MKLLLTLITLILFVGCNGQDTMKCETYYHVLVHESNIDKIPEHELSVSGDNLTWSKSDYSKHLDYIKERMRKSPPEYAEGFEFTEFIFDKGNGNILWSIGEGYYWKMHREKAERYMIDIRFDVEEIMYAQHCVYIYLKDGKICHEIDKISKCDKYNFMPLYRITVNINDGIITQTKDDWRGFNLNTIK